MTSVTDSGVAGSASLQADRLALLVKLFQIDGKSTEAAKRRPFYDAGPPSSSPLPQHPAQVNSAAGLASMFKALQASNTNSVSDLLSRMLEAVDVDGDGAISTDELHAVTEMTPSPTRVESQTPVPSLQVRNGGAGDVGLMSRRDLAANPAVDADTQDTALTAQSAYGLPGIGPQSRAEQTWLGTLAVQRGPTARSGPSAYETLYQAIKPLARMFGSQLNAVA